MITHLACIMDGNRRWAQRQGWRAWDGHRAGVKAAGRAVDFCLSHSIPYLTLYTFSIENFKRSEQEKKFLFTILFKELKKDFIQQLIEKGVRVRFVGDRSLFPDGVAKECDEIEAMTQKGAQLQLNLLFAYGSRQEILHGVKTVAQQVANGSLSVDEITDQDFQNCLWTAGTPAPDIIVRTGGVSRLSNFLLFQAAYSELFFLDCMWPDISIKDLDTILEKFNETQRNFGS